MDTFIYFAGLRETCADRAISAARAGLGHLYGQALDMTVEISSEAARDFVLLSARSARPAPPVDACVTERFVVLLYGRAERDAEAIQRALACWPVEAVVSDVAGGEGCFGCLIHDRQEGVLHLFGDMVGQRTLRWAEAEGAFVVAPHDAALAASGLVSPAPDPVSCASVSAVGWSLGDVSLLASVSVCRAGDLVTLAPAGACGRGRARLVVGDLLRRAPEPGGSLAEVALAYLDREIGAAEATVELDGTPGSQTALAAAVALRGRDAITAICSESGAAAGLRWRPLAPAVPGRGALAAAWSRAAAAGNGVVDPRFLLSAPRRAGSIVICGDGACAVASASAPAAGAPGPSATLAGQILPGSLPDEVSEALARRVRDVLRRLRAGRGTADLRTLFDRDQRWGVGAQGLARDPACLHRVSPFGSRALIRAADAAPGGLDRLRSDLGRHLPALGTGLQGTRPTPVPGLAALAGLAAEIVAERDGAWLLDADPAPQGADRREVAAPGGPTVWRELGPQRFLRICRDASDSARRARAAAEIAPLGEGGTPPRAARGPVSSAAPSRR